MASECNEPSGPFDGIRLEVLSGPLQGKTFLLEEAQISIGRDLANDIPILDGLVSRRHCEIRKDGSEFRLVDLDSSNCTFVNGVPTTGRALAPQSKISLIVFGGT